MIYLSTPTGVWLKPFSVFNNILEGVVNLAPTDSYLSGWGET